MIPSSFDYRAPATLDEAVGLLQSRAGEAKILAGGQSLIPMLKLRLVQPALIIDGGARPRQAGGRDRARHNE